MIRSAINHTQCMAAEPVTTPRSSRPACGSCRYRNLEAFLSVENVTNVDWREAQFFFTSRLPGEPAGGIADIHYTPGTPRSFLGGLALRF